MGRMTRVKKDFEGRVLIASLAVLSGFYFIQTLTGWWFLANSGIRGPYRFLDLNLVLKSFDCYPIVGDQVFAPPTDDPCRGYIYGRQFFYLMTNLNIGENLSNLIAIIFAISFLMVLMMIRKPHSKNSR
jgi:hypothetical protein